MWKQRAAVSAHQTCRWKQASGVCVHTEVFFHGKVRLNGNGGVCVSSLLIVSLLCCCSQLIHLHMFPLFQPPPLKGQSLICSVTVHEERTRRRGQRTYSSNVSGKSEKSKKVVPVCIRESERCDLVPSPHHALSPLVSPRALF